MALCAASVRARADMRSDRSRCAWAAVMCAPPPCTAACKRVTSNRICSISSACVCVRVYTSWVCVGLGCSYGRADVD